MAELKEYTFDDVKPHDSKKDLWMVIHDNIYDISSFVDEHPGGEEVLMDVGGQDATDSFEDVGHSDEAREILEKLIAGKLKRTEKDPKPKATPALGSSTSTQSSDGGATLYAFFVLAAIVAYGAYRYMT